MARGSNDDGRILIVGAGPVGLSLAVELVRHGAPCRIVEKAPSPSVHSKALAIMPRTLEIFEDMGIGEAVLAQGHRVDGAIISVGRRPIAQPRFRQPDSAYPFALTLPQSETEKILIRRLADSGVPVEREIELAACTQDARGVTAHLRHGRRREEVVRVPWLVGCDGSHSTVRHAMSIPFDGDAYHQTFGLADATLAGPVSEDALHIFLHREGLLGLFPLGKGQWRVVANLETRSAAPEETPTPPTLDEIRTVVDRRGPGGLRVETPTWLATFRIHHRRVRQLRKGRVFLAGDAAHVHSPAGGQGMNTGIQDAYNLAWKLALVATGEGSSFLLDSYDAERRPVAEQVSRLTDRITRVLTVEPSFVRGLRNRLLLMFLRVPALRDRLPRVLSEFDVNYRHGPLSLESWSGGGGPAAGDRAPDGPLRDGASGEPRRVHEVVRGPRHTLLLFAGAVPRIGQSRNLHELARVLRRGREGQLKVFLVWPGAATPADSPGDAAILLDAERTVHERYGARSLCAYVIRPDGYVGHRSMPANTEAIRSYFGRVFLRV